MAGLASEYHQKRVVSFAPGTSRAAVDGRLGYVGGGGWWRSRAVARAAAPSPRPVRPRPSVVGADRLTQAPPSAADNAAWSSSRRGAIRGRLPMTWTETLPIVQPASE